MVCPSRALVILWIGWGWGVGTGIPRPFPRACWWQGPHRTTRSLSGHVADWGDVTLAVMMDGLHLLAGGLWGWGSGAHLYGIATSEQVRRPATPIAGRPGPAFCYACKHALAVVLLTGFANAWVQVGTMRALWATPYGRTLLVKLLLVGLVILLGTVNHYLYVPLLRQQTGRPVAGDGSCTLRACGSSYPPGGRHQRDAGLATVAHCVVESLCWSACSSVQCSSQDPPARSSSHATWTCRDDAHISRVSRPLNAPYTRLYASARLYHHPSNPGGIGSWRVFAYSLPCAKVLSASPFSLFLHVLFLCKNSKKSLITAQMNSIMSLSLLDAEALPSYDLAPSRRTGMTHSIIGVTARRTRPVGMERRLAAILSADVQGYSRLMHEDETATIQTLTAIAVSWRRSSGSIGAG
jgi:hypothetical protein